MKNKILDLFQSEEMRTYIDENFDNLSSYKINNIIRGILDKFILYINSKEESM